MSECRAPCPDASSESGAPQPTLRQQADQLHRRIGQLVKLERQATRDLAISLARMERDKLHHELGYARIGEYGEQALGISGSKARQLAQLGRKLPQLPAMDKAMNTGALGWTKARTLLPVVNDENEQAWVERAISTTNRELEDQASACIRGDAPPDPEDDFQPTRHVWTSIRLDAYHFEQVMKAVGEIRHHLGDADISMSQALLWMAELCLDGAMFPVEDGEQEGENAAHVCSVDDPRDRYPRGRQFARIGDEVEMAPPWVARNIGLA